MTKRTAFCVNENASSLQGVMNRHMEISVKSLAAKLNRVQEKRKSLFEKFADLEKLLTDTFAGTEIYASSSDATLEQIGLDDYLYGHLRLSEDGLTVAYRSTEDDYYDNFHGTSEEYKSYKFKHFSICSPKWLESIFVERTVTSLLENLNAKLDEMDGIADQSLTLFEKILETESEEIHAQMVTTLKHLGDEILNRSWTAANAAANLDPADGLTRSSSFLESACRKILKDRNQELPQTITISTLVDGCVRALDWPLDTTAQEDIRKITGGVKSIFAGVGALRTHFGTAHGSSSDQTQLDSSYAKLANNAAAAVAIFLLQRHLKNSLASK